MKQFVLFLIPALVCSLAYSVTGRNIDDDASLLAAVIREQIDEIQRMVPNADVVAPPRMTPDEQETAVEFFVASLPDELCSDIIDQLSESDGSAATLSAALKKRIRTHVVECSTQQLPKAMREEILDAYEEVETTGLVSFEHSGLAENVQRYIASTDAEDDVRLAKSFWKKLWNVVKGVVKIIASVIVL